MARYERDYDSEFGRRSQTGPQRQRGIGGGYGGNWGGFSVEGGGDDSQEGEWPAGHDRSLPGGRGPGRGWRQGPVGRWGARSGGEHRDDLGEVLDYGGESWGGYGGGGASRGGESWDGYGGGYGGEGASRGGSSWGGYGGGGANRGGDSRGGYGGGYGGGGVSRSGESWSGYGGGGSSRGGESRGGYDGGYGGRSAESGFESGYSEGWQGERGGRKSRGFMRAAEIMTEDPEVVTPETNLTEVAKKMRDLDVGIMPIVASGENRRLRGVITDRDIAVRAIAEGKDGSARVSECMTGEVRSVNKNDSIEDVMRIMRREQIRRVPVTDREGRLVGIISQADLAVDYGRDDSSRRREVGATLERISEPARPDRGRPRMAASGRAGRSGGNMESMSSGPADRASGGERQAGGESQAGSEPEGQAKTE